LTAVAKQPRTDINTVKRYAALVEKKATAKAELQAAEAELKQQEELVVLYFQNQGVPSITVGNRTIHLRRELWASIKPGLDMDKVRATLESIGLGDLCKNAVNRSTLSSEIRTYDARLEGNEKGDVEALLKTLPPELAEIVNVSESFKIGATKR
jgi:hypothetical protein